MNARMYKEQNKMMNKEKDEPSGFKERGIRKFEFVAKLISFMLFS